jgi:cytoskeleton protein RodZ
MPEIGATLREARMRARIDISEIETQTKIRAKYLRALENEEWDLLPGPTYVKSFLRTYADALHLDGKRLVEEYKLGHERLSDVELQPIAPPGRRVRPPAGRIASIRRGWFVAVAVLVLVAALYLLGRGTGGSGDAGQPATPSTQPASGQTPTTPGTQQDSPGSSATPRRVRLRIVPTAPVYVCLVADGSRRLVTGVLQPGSPSPAFRARRFTMTLGNGSANLRIDGRTFNVPQSSGPLGYAITPRGRQTLAANRRPTCGQ